MLTVAQTKAVERLRKAARETLVQYSDLTKNHNQVPEFPQWAKDALDICNLLEKTIRGVQ